MSGGPVKVSAKGAALLELPTSGPRTWPVFALLETVTLLVALLPGPVLELLASVLGLLVALAARWRAARPSRHGRGPLGNMDLVFHGRPPRGLLAAYGRHVALLVLEQARLRRLTPRRLRRAVDLGGFDTLRALQAEGKGVIVASGHMGNWELLSYAAGLEGLGNVVLARPCPEAGLERWLRRHRERSGQHVLPKFGGLWPLKKALDRGAIVGLNCDEAVRENGVVVPFCGLPASTTASAAQLQRIKGAPIAVMTCQRVGADRHRILVWAVVRPDRAAPAEAEVQRVTAEIARGLEAALRAYPAQWLWGLRRWELKSAPDPAKQAH